MYLKCVECGHVFELGEKRVVKEDHGEEFGVCPVCGEAYSEAGRCDECGTIFAEDDLYKGKCDDCWKELALKCDYNLALKFLTETKDLVYFMYGHHFQSDIVIKEVSESLLEEARMSFMRCKFNDNMSTRKYFLEEVRGYLKDSLDDGNLCWSDWADCWIEYNREVKK